LSSSSGSRTVVREFEFDPFDPETIEDPFPKYRVLRDELPVYYNRRRDIWAISRADDVHSLMRNWETCSSSKGMDLDDTGLMFGPGNFLNMDPPDHDTLRKLVRPSFTARRIKELEPVARRKVTLLIDRFAGEGHADFARDLSSQLPVAMISELLGVPRSDQDSAGALVHTIMRRRAGDAEIPPESRAANTELADYFEHLAAERRQRPAEDLLTDIVHAEFDGQRMPAEMVLGLSLLLYGAGSETVSNFTSNALVVLARHPEARAELFAEPAGIPVAIEELLRFESPVQNLARSTKKAITLHDQEIPADSRLALLLGSANRDEREWGPQADKLDLKRPLKRRHVAFGEGIHFCLGAPLARLQGRIVLEEIAQRLPKYEINGTVKRVMKVNSRGFESLPVTF
jgi:cytochrome P450